MTDVATKPLQKVKMPHRARSKLGDALAHLTGITGELGILIKKKSSTREQYLELLKIHFNRILKMVWDIRRAVKSLRKAGYPPQIIAKLESFENAFNRVIPRMEKLMDKKDTVSKRDLEDSAFSSFAAFRRMKQYIGKILPV
ncbi:MAG: hypothetical protein V3V78_02100 [Candidatus Woesearchaeota archaeon]